MGKKGESINESTVAALQKADETENSFLKQ